MLKFLVRPRWFEGESWPGYLLRFANSNHFDGIHRLAEILAMTPKLLLASSPHHICQLLGVSSAAPELESPVGKVRLKRHIRLAGARRSLYGRVCPLCLSAFSIPHLSAKWDLSANMRCEIHHVFLIDECPACSKHLSFKRRLLTRCDCGFDLGTAECRPESQALLNLEATLDVDVARSLGSGTFAADSEKFQAVHRLLRRLLKVSRPDFASIDLRKSGHFPARLFSQKEFDQIAAWFEHWPHGFRSNWKTVDAALQDVGSYNRIKTFLGRSGFPSIDAEIRFNRNDRRRKDSPDHQMSLNWSDQQSENRFVDLQTCIQMTNTYERTVKLWIERGWLGNVRLSKMPNGTTKFEIELEMVKAVISFLSRTSSPKTMSEELGISHRAVRALLDSNVLKYSMISRCSEGRRINAQSAYALADSIIRKTISPGGDPIEKLFLSQVIEKIASRKWCTPALLLRCILMGEFAAYLDPSAPRTLEHVYCCGSDLQNWIHRYQGGDVVIP